MKKSVIKLNVGGEKNNLQVYCEIYKERLHIYNLDLTNERQFLPSDIITKNNHTFPLYIPINVELSSHVGVPNLPKLISRFIMTSIKRNFTLIIYN